MPTIQKFEDLECWKEARTLVNLVHAFINKSNSTSFKLVDQISSASVSVMSNIAEGFASQTNPEFIRFLKMSRRSTSEVQSLAYVFKDIAHLEKNDFASLYEQCKKCRKLIDGLLRYLRAQQNRRT